MMIRIRFPDISLGLGILFFQALFLLDQQIEIIGVGAVSYPLSESYQGTNFFDGFKYPVETYDNTTSGDVFWATAENTSLIYINEAGRIIMKVDNTSNVVYNEKRYAPKLLSKAVYSPGTVFVLDAVHLPYGCSVWPGFWTQGPDWPVGGEIDIMENINMATTNQIALHTGGGSCIASSTNSFTGTEIYTNCSVDANYGSGCTINDTNTVSYGANFAAAGGGVYIAEFAEEHIKIWFIQRGSIPSSITAKAESIDTSTLGEATAEYDSSTCDFTTNFGPQTLTIDITLCGAWAGIASTLEETCPALIGTNTCYTTYVIGDASATYANAYFEINYLNIYSSNSSTSNGSDTNPSGAPRPTTTITAGVSATAAATGTGKAASGANIRWRDGRNWEGASMLGTGIVAAMVLGLGVML